MNGTPNLITLHATDNVAVALRDINAGDPLTGQQITASSDIAKSHKMALCPIASGQPIIKYGNTIGVAAEPINTGEWVHLHNMRMPLNRSETLVTPSPTMISDRESSLTFNGYRRPDGRVGTRNYLIVVATVSCANATAKAIADAAWKKIGMQPGTGIDGIIPIVHTQGCGMVVGSPGYQILQRTLTGCIHHPNVAGALILGLGCEMNSAAKLNDLAMERGAAAVRRMEVQSCGGTPCSIARGLEVMCELAQTACGFPRRSVSVAELSLALQCGGSDAFSGISANPALGAAADYLVRAGGQVILSETPEIYGAEHLLSARAETPEVRAALYRKIAWWKSYAKMHGATLDHNPAPGNHEGGVTTIIEKSLGAISKGGTTPLRDVMAYAAPSRRKGLVFMDSPGYDPVSVTGQIASGANMVAFTTGRGSSYGAFLAPVLKIASNSATYCGLASDMDIDCGGILDKTLSLSDTGKAILLALVEAASGKKTSSEVHFNGNDLFNPWHLGAVM